MADPFFFSLLVSYLLLNFFYYYYREENDDDEARPHLKHHITNQLSSFSIDIVFTMISTRLT